MTRLEWERFCEGAEGRGRERGTVPPANMAQVRQTAAQMGAIISFKMRGLCMERFMSL